MCRYSTLTKLIVLLRIVPLSRAHYWFVCFVYRHSWSIKYSVIIKTKIQRVCGTNDSTILDICTMWRLVISFTLRSHYSREKMLWHLKVGFCVVVFIAVSDAVIRVVYNYPNMLTNNLFTNLFLQNLLSWSSVPSMLYIVEVSGLNFGLENVYAYSFLCFCNSCRKTVKGDNHKIFNEWFIPSLFQLTSHPIMRRKRNMFSWKRVVRWA